MHSLPILWTPMCCSGTSPSSSAPWHPLVTTDTARWSYLKPSRVPMSTSTIVALIHSTADQPSLTQLTPAPNAPLLAPTCNRLASALVRYITRVTSMRILMNTQLMRIASTMKIAERFYSIYTHSVIFTLWIQQLLLSYWISVILSTSSMIMKPSYMWRPITYTWIPSHQPQTLPQTRIPFILTPGVTEEPI